MIVRDIYVLSKVNESIASSEEAWSFERLDAISE